MPQFSDQPLTVFQIHRQSFILYKHTFPKLWYVILINLAIINLIGFAVLKILVSNVHNVAQVSPAISTGMSLTYLAISFIMLMYATAVVIHRMYCLATAETALLMSSYITVLRKLVFIVLTLTVVFMLIVVGFLLFLPGVFLIFLFPFCLAAILFEDQKFWGAIRRSCQLVWGNWFHTFNGLVSTVIVISIFGFFINLNSHHTYNLWLNLGVSGLFFVFVSPWLFSVYLVQYNDLKVREKAKKLIENQEKTDNSKASAI